MKKEEIYQWLEDQGIPYEVTEHPAVITMEDLEAIEWPYPNSNGKNLFVRDDKKRNYYLITVKNDKRVDLKEFRNEHGTRRLSFASAEEMKERLGLEQGAVSPLGLINDSTHSVHFYFDRAFLKGTGMLGVHPNDNTATVWLKAEDLIALVEKLGNPVHVVAIDSPELF
ncbi:prolyl-tRNA synthetase associated domain-containing protein [Facklamia lactis]|uniref:prolyl-tRNA synthetase associated domain-containing protein n=1 Tax=Facklamia lactis TaxID=2749967 RepID=UPI0018CE882F|nr:prolyl-tRNA synthetase associated domain-containing protein [Facklamia lactis]MBG9981087.1 prolyl-tRNA synthetase associated domain-containing protein [Facklamia lactis]